MDYNDVNDSFLFVADQNLNELDDTNINNAIALKDHSLRNAIITLFYSLIVIISLCGNILVVKTVAMCEKMRNPTNILIATLAFSDLLMTIFNIPFTVADIITRNWVFGAFFCSLVSFVQANCVYVSSFTMAFIAAYRWKSIYGSHSVSRSVSTTSGQPDFCWKLGICIGIIWMLAGFHSIPHTIFNQIIEMPTKSGEVVARCYAKLPESIPNFQLILTLETLITQYVIPLSISGVIYARIGATISAQGRVGEVSQQRQREMYQRKRKRIVMLILVVIIFALCWLPLNVYYLLVDFGVIQMNFHIFLPCHWFAMSSVCYNPFVYCWLNESFRNEAKRIFSFLFRLSSGNTSPELSV